MAEFSKQLSEQHLVPGRTEDSVAFPLSTVIAQCVAGILVAGMAAYACVQYFVLPGESVWRLVAEHLAHVVFLMLLVYGVLYFVLLKVVVAPIRTFRAKLYRVAGGDLTPITDRSRIAEIQEMADGINVMIMRLSGGLPHASLADLSVQAVNLRHMTQQADNLDLNQKDILLDTAETVEAVVAAITKNIVHHKDTQKRTVGEIDAEKGMPNEYGQSGAAVEKETCDIPASDRARE